MSWMVDGVRRSLSKGDVRGAGALVVSSFSERFHEWRYGIRSSRSALTDGIALPGTDFHYYEPTDFRRLHRIFRMLRVRAHADEMVDLGAGAGRAVVVAASHPFRSVTGVEISPQLSDLARENVRISRARRRCSDVRIVTGDASVFPIPESTTLVFMFNPFSGPILRRAVENIRRSYDARPRRLSLVCTNPGHIERDPEFSALFRKTGEFRMGPEGLRTAFFQVLA